MKLFKFGHSWRILDSIKEQIRSEISYINDALYLPVPISKRRQNERGYNQAKLICNLFQVTTSDTIPSGLLKKLSDTPPQSSLPDTLRFKLNSNAYMFDKSRLPSNIRKICLVDDVITSGATVTAISEAVKKAVPHIEIYAFSLFGTYKTGR